MHHLMFGVFSVALAFLVVLFLARSLWESRSCRPLKHWQRVEVPTLLRHAKTGDLLVFSGNGGDSLVIKGWSWSPWSHCGMVVRGPSPDDLYLWNANVDNSRLDAIQGRPLREGGTQLNDLEMSVRAYDGVICWRPLSRAIPLHQIVPILKDLSERKFDHDAWDLLGSTTTTPLGAFIAWVRGRLPVHDDRHFCSELILRTFQLAGVVGNESDPLTTHPTHFMEPHDQSLAWRDSYFLEEARVVEQ